MKWFVTVSAVLMLAVQAQAQIYDEGTWRLLLNTGVNIPGDEYTRKYSKYTLGPLGSIGAEYFVFNRVALQLQANVGWLENSATNLRQKDFYLPYNSTSYSTIHSDLLLGGALALPTLFRFTPMVFGRVGLLLFHTNGTFDSRTQIRSGTALTYGGGAGIEYPLSREITIRGAYLAHLTSSDLLDGAISGGQNDGLSIISIGISWALNLLPEAEYNIRHAPASPVFPEDVIAVHKKIGHDNPPGSRETSVPGDGSTEIEAGIPNTPEGGEGKITEETTRSSIRKRPARAAGETRDAESDDPETDEQETTLAAGEDDAANRNRTPEGQHTVDTGQKGEADPASGNTIPPVPPKNAFVDAEFNVMDFESIPGLRHDAEALTLTTQTKGETAVPVSLRFELLDRAGSVLAESERSMSLSGTKRTFQAPSFIDLDGMTVPESIREAFPTGRYIARVNIRPEESSESVDLPVPFVHLNYPSMFGTDADRIRFLVRSGKVGVTIPVDDNVVFNTYGRQFAKASIGNIAPAAPAATSSRDAYSIVPAGDSYDEQKAFISGYVREAFNKAFVILNSKQKAPDSPEHVSIVAAEVYFPFDQSQLTDEAQAVLDQIALQLRQHPEIDVELRGFADDVGDAAYGTLLSQRRADRVFEHLNRRQIPDSRIHAHGMGTNRPYLSDSGGDRRRNRKVQIVFGEGLD